MTLKRRLMILTEDGKSDPNPIALGTSHFTSAVRVLPYAISAVIRVFVQTIFNIINIYYHTKGDEQMSVEKNYRAPPHGGVLETG